MNDRKTVLIRMMIAAAVLIALLLLFYFLTPLPELVLLTEHAAAAFLQKIEPADPLLFSAGYGII